MILCSVLLAVLWLRSTIGGDVPGISSTDEISRINNLRSDEAPQVNIDPRLRRALLRVLTKLEEQDQKKGTQEAARQMAEVMQNIISEEDFIKYFQEQGLEKELLEGLQTKESSDEDDQKNSPNFEEILSYSSEDNKRDQEVPFTFASYPEDKVKDTTPDTVKDFQNKEKYPSTNPTPSLGDAFFFQIPEPIHIQDSDNEEDDEKISVNVQETRSIQGPTLVSPTNDNEYHSEKQEMHEDQKVSFVKGDETDKDISQEEQSVHFITVGETEKNEVHKDDDDNEPKTQVEVHASNGTEVEDNEEKGNSSMKAKLEKHEVEFLHSSLLAAFTVQQDQQGLPRRVIPLNYQASGDPLPLPNNKDQQKVFTSQSSLEGRQRNLQEQLRFLQDQQLQEQQYQRLQEFVKQRQRLLDEEAQRQLLLDSQKRQLENEQRLVLARQRQQQILFQGQQHDNQLETLKELERQRYYQQQQTLRQQQPQNYQFPQQQTHPQNFQFQKSVDFQFQTNGQRQQQGFSQPLSLNSFQPSFNTFNNFQPSVELNRVNRHEPSNFIGNFGFSTPQPSLNFHSQGRSTIQPFVNPTQPTYVQPSNFIQTNFQQQQRFPQPNNFVTTQPPLTLDGQLQSLLSISGIAGGLRGKPSASEDLNIVSKVLALGHGNYQFPRQQFQASSKYEQVVEPPSRVIEPPKL